MRKEGGGEDERKGGKSKGHSKTKGLVSSNDMEKDGKKKCRKSSLIRDIVS